MSKKSIHSWFIYFPFAAAAKQNQPIAMFLWQLEKLNSSLYMEWVFQWNKRPWRVRWLRRPELADRDKSRLFYALFALAGVGKRARDFVNETAAISISSANWKAAARRKLHRERRLARSMQTHFIKAGELYKFSARCRSQIKHRLRRDARSDVFQ